MLLEVRDLTINYGSILALDKISLFVHENDFVALLGANGAGKSTTLKSVAGLVKPTSGEILLKGQSIIGCSPDTLVRREVCLVPEGRRVFQSMTVRENLEMGGYTLDSRKDLSKAAEMMFSLFPVLKERRNQRAGTLSSGEQQMLAIARALMLKPTLLMLDEPSLGLSPEYVEQVFTKLQEIKQAGVTILMVEQNARRALECTDRAYVFETGRILCSGRSSDLLQGLGNRAPLSSL